MPEPATTSAPPSTSVWWRRAPELALAALVYLPLLLTQPGKVGADTKTYLYLDPARLLADAPYLWDPGTGLGTVTHQNIGYLWPSGPFYWLFETAGLPDWVAQRIWLGTIIVAAGIGVLALLRELGWAHDRPGDGRLSVPGWWNGGMVLAAFAYALSPYLLAVAARISVILLPWAALPWFILYVERALRRNSWRDPAIFALIVLTVGAINFTSLFLVGLGPLLWLVWRSIVERSVDLRRTFAVVGRIGLLTLSVSAWWLAGLVLQGAYSVPIVRYTETYEAVAVASTTPEVLRGLGYWFFYGNDKLGQWVIPSVHYMRLGLPVSFALPTLALMSGALLRFRRRGFFLALIVVGAVVAVGGHPYDDPSPIGSVLRAFTRNDFGLAFRSTPRAVPLLILGTSVLLGAGLNALADRLPRWTVPAAGLAVLLVLANLPSLFVGQMVDRNLRRPEEIPTYWQEAASFLDERSHDTRVLELPGTDFAAYRWGNTVDPVTPGLMDRPYVARELIPLGSPVSANLVNAIDRPLQEGTFEPEALGPLARLISAGDVVLRSDLEYERFRTPRPEATWELLNAVPGLDEPIGFGEPVENEASPALPLLDEVELATPDDLEDPPPVAVFPVEDAPAIVRTLPTDAPTVLSGDGDGLVAATAAGLIDPDRAILYSADLLTDESLTAIVLDDGARIIVTDSNRRRARRWGTIRENEGYTEQAGEEPLRLDVSDARLDVFPEVTDDSRTVSVQEGGASVTATAYGNPVTYTPGDRAAFALDGDPSTAWKVGAFSEVDGETIRVDLDEPTELDSLTLLQPSDDLPNRWITEVQVSLDGDAFDVELDERSRAEPGQLVEFEPREAERVEIEITDDNIGFRPKLTGVSAVGFAEIGLGEVAVTEYVRPPVDIVEQLGDQLSDHDLSYVFQRLRNNPAEPVRVDEEPAMRRIVDLPVGRAFELSGQARVAAEADDALVDTVLGVDGADGITATSSQRLAGDLTTRARSAIDGDPTTAWSTPFAGLVGQWIEVEYPQPTTVSRLDLELVDDARHSVPTKVRVSADDGPGQVVDLPPSPGPGELGTTVSVPIEIDPIEGRSIRVTIEEVAERTTIDWYSAFPVALPVAITELGLPGTSDPVGPGEPEVLGACRDDIVLLDGEPVPVRLDGGAEDAVERSPLGVSTCDGEPLELTPGAHRIESVPGADSGIDLDRLVLDSVVAAPPAPSPDAPATVEIDGETRVSYDLTVPDADEPFWLALGQSRNEGWEATATGASLSEPTTISGFGNGWYVQPDGTGPVQIELRWTPQQLVWYAAGWSLLAVLACAVLIIRGRGRERTGEEVGAGIVLAPLDSDLPPVAAGRQAMAAVGAAAVAFLVSTPAVAVLTGLAVLVAFRHRRGPLYVRLLPPVLYGLIAGYVMVENVVVRAPVDFAWPPQFEPAHWPGMLVVLLVGVEVGLAILRRDP